MQVKDLLEKIEFEFGDKVEFNNRVGKDEGIVIGMTLRPDGIRYAVKWSNKEEEWHYSIELKKKDG